MPAIAFELSQTVVQDSIQNLDVVVQPVTIRWLRSVAVTALLGHALEAQHVALGAYFIEPLENYEHK